MLAYLHALISVNEDLKTIGALAGLAAVPGLAVLSLLYFGQAREVRRLRDWAGRAPERAAELEQRVTADAQARAQGQPVARPATAPATTAGQAATAAPATSAPGGNGVAKQPEAPQPATVAAQATGAPAEAKEGEADAKKDEAKPTADGEKKPAADDEKKPEGDGEKKPEGEKAAEKEPAAATKDGEAPKPAAAPAPAAAVPAASAAATAATAAPKRTPAPPVPPRPRPAAPVRASVPSATIPPSRRGALGGEDGERRITPRRVLTVGGSLLAVGLVFLIVLVFIGNDEKSTPPAPNTVAEAPVEGTPDGASTAGPGSAGERAQTSVAVLNGTTVTGLARGVATRLEDLDYTTTTVTDAANQAQADTKVEYTSGHREEAQALAKVIKVPASQVVAATPDDTTTAGPNAEVIVVVGQNFAR